MTEASAPHSDVSQAKATVTKMNTGIQLRNRQELADTLARSLAETYMLYLKTQGFHWNVVGPQFYGLHKLTEVQYQDLAEAVDELAERIRALGYPAPATFKQFLELSALKESPEVQTAEDGIRSAVHLADDDDDIVSADMLTQRMKVHEKAAWMLRSLLAH